MKNYQLGLYEKSMPGSLTIPEKLKEAAAAGFDYLELSIDETDEKLARLDWSRDETAALNQVQLEIGIPIKSICLSGHRRFPLGHPDREIRQASLVIMEKAIRLAARLGIRIIQLAGYDVYYEPSTAETRARFAEGLAACVETAACEGVILAFETMETEFLNTVAKAMDWVNAMQSPYLQVYPDIGNLTNAALQYGGNVADDLFVGKGYIAAVHLKETRPGIYREVPYGEGHVDFSVAAAVSLKLGVRMFVGEFWYDGQEDWRERLRGSNQFLRNCLDNALSSDAK